MRSVWKKIRRIILFLLILVTGAVILNRNTRFFKDIGKNVPLLDNIAPEFADNVSTFSDKVNLWLSEIPSPAEVWGYITSQEPELAEDDIAPNEYIKSDTMLNFYSGDNISIAVSGSTADVFGTRARGDERYLVYRFYDKAMNTLSDERGECDFSGQFHSTFSIPDGADQLAVYTGAELSGEYRSNLYNYIYLDRDESGGWSIAYSPVYEHNVEQFEKSRSLSASIKNTYDVCCDYGDIKSLAETLSRGCGTDYEKALRIHDWVCENIYYDEDGVSSNNLDSTAYVASDVLYRRKAACLGYSNLYAALCRAAGLHCTVVTGYALGVTEGESAWTDESINTGDANHAWNEVNLEGRWVIVDATWDSQNKLKDGVWESGNGISHLFFDANLRFFSQNHKITGYSK